jgi:hypothetical protein
VCECGKLVTHNVLLSVVVNGYRLEAIKAALLSRKY